MYKQEHEVIIILAELCGYIQKSNASAAVRYLYFESPKISLTSQMDDLNFEVYAS